MKRLAVLAMLSVASLGFLAGCDLDIAGGKGSIAIKSTPDRAEVFINGAPQGPTPATISGLAAGSYLIELRKDGFERAYKSVGLLDGQQLEVDIQLKKTTGLLLVESNPPGVDVIIDEISKGNTPLLLTDLPMGRYKLEFRSPTQLPRTMEAVLADRRPVRVFAELTSNTARLEVTSVPEGAEVRIDGVLVGTTPATIEEMVSGEADVKISKRGYNPFSRHMNFEATRVYQINAELDSLPSGLTIITSPEGAKVTIDKKAVGIAPITLNNLKGGSHEITVVLDGYEPQTKTFYLEPDINDSAEFNLVKNSGTLMISTEPANVQIFVDGKLLTTTQPKGSSESLSQPVRITLKSDLDHSIQLVREGFVSSSISVKTEIDQVITRHEILKRIFVYDTKIVTDTEVIKCRMEYKLPNGNIYYERYPGVFATAVAADIRDVQPINLDDESNREARRLLEANRQTVPRQ